VDKFKILKHFTNFTKFWTARFLLIFQYLVVDRQIVYFLLNVRSTDSILNRNEVPCLGDVQLSLPLVLTASWAALREALVSHQYGSELV